MQSNNLKVRLNSNGLFSDSAGIPAISNSSNFSFADRVGVWMSATDSQGKIYVACHDVIGGKQEFWPGPLSLNNQVSADSTVWNKVYPMNSSLIASHIANYQSASYVPHPLIAQWPGSGPAGFAGILAPFVDNEVNDKIYDPLNGDYPYIRSSSEILAISNDRANTHLNSQAWPMGVELHTSTMGFAPTDTLLKNCIMVRYLVFNRSATTYKNFRFSVAVNFGIGMQDNEYLGTDVPNKTLFAINDTSEATFSGKLVSFACMALNGRLSSTIYFENTGDPVNGRPAVDTHFVRLMKGIWKNGNPMVYGGNGVDASGSQTSFVYPYNTDDSHGNQMWSDNDRYQPGKRYGLLNFDSIELKAGTATSFEVAFFIVEENNFNIKQIGNSCLSIRQALNTKNLMKNTQNLGSFVEKNTLYPNPLKPGDNLVIKGLQEKPISMRIMGLDGREIYKFDLHDSDINCILPFDFSDGVYFLEYETLNTKKYIKFVVNR